MAATPYLVPFLTIVAAFCLLPASASFYAERSLNFNISSLAYILPGQDHIGFGYDLRYSEIEEAIRLPLVSNTYDLGKTYSYPLNRTRTFIVPDAVYVRTVGRTTASSYVFSSITDFQQSESLDKGVPFFQPATTSPLDTLDQAARTSLLAILAGNATGTQNVTQALSTNCSDPQNGAHNSVSCSSGGNTFNLAPTSVTSQSSSAFSAGSETLLLNNLLSSGEQWVMKNDQKNHLFQLILQEAAVRDGVQSDIEVLYGKTWETDPQSFVDFFEKYGTHYVAALTMGGAITMTTIMTKSAQSLVSSTTTTTFFNSSNSNSTTTTVTCQDDYTGYILNNNGTACVLPPEVNCTSTITSIFHDHQYTPDYNFPAPNPPPTAPIEILKCEEQIASACYWVSQPIFFWWFYSWRIICYNFEYPVCGWVQASRNMTMGVATIAQKVTAPSGCTDCDGSQYTFDSTNQEFNRTGVGSSITLPTPAKPNLVSFWVESSQTNRNHNYMSFWDIGDPKNSTDDKMILQWVHNNQSQAGIYVDSRTFYGIPYIANTWYEVKLVFHYAEPQSFDLWIRNTTGFWKQIQKAIPFLSTRIAAIGRVDLYSFDQHAIGKFQSLYFCNPAGQEGYLPIDKVTAVASATAFFKSQTSATTDYTFENQHSSQVFEQTTMFKLRGGDSLVVDLLNPANADGSSAFEGWKYTVFQNPAPISMTLKEIATLFPDEEFYGVNSRDAMADATHNFIVNEAVTDIIVDSSPDEPNYLPF